MANLLDRISINPKICRDQPCVKGTRIMVWFISNTLPMVIERDSRPKLDRLLEVLLD
jgi:uncharacterized protein (DUF433 family)